MNRPTPRGETGTPLAAIDASGHLPAKVTRVIFASVSRVQGSVMDQLFEIRNRYCEAGQTPTVRVALLYSRGWFVFWLEGPEAEVEALVQHVSRDPRNAHQKLLHRSLGAPSLNTTFAVVVTQGAEGPGAFGRRVFHVKHEMEEGIVREPASVWQCLSAPCTVTTHRGYGQPPDRHVALLAAEDNGPLDLLRKLGERFDSEVIYQRFANAKSYSSDVGVAYVDIPVGRKVMRVRLLSRRALGQPMVRQSLSGLDGLALLLGSRPSAAIELVASVTTVVAALRVRPVIGLVAPNDNIVAPVGELLQRGPAGATPKVFALPEAQFEDFLFGRLQPHDMDLHDACVAV